MSNKENEQGLKDGVEFTPEQLAAFDAQLKAETERMAAQKERSVPGDMLVVPGGSVMFYTSAMKMIEVDFDESTASVRARVVGGGQLVIRPVDAGMVLITAE